MRKRKSNRPVGRRYAADEVTERLSRFEVARSRGDNVTEAAAKAGASPTTIRRWTLEAGSRVAYLPGSRAQNITVEAAIEGIIDVSNGDRLTLMVAIFKLMSWMRWPSQPALHPVVSLSVV